MGLYCGDRGERLNERLCHVVQIDFRILTWPLQSCFFFFNPALQGDFIKRFVGVNFSYFACLKFKISDEWRMIAVRQTIILYMHWTRPCATGVSAAHARRRRLSLQQHLTSRCAACGSFIQRCSTESPKHSHGAGAIWNIEFGLEGGNKLARRGISYQLSNMCARRKNSRYFFKENDSKQGSNWGWFGFKWQAVNTKGERPRFLFSLLFSILYNISCGYHICAREKHELFN